jgi:hypothetical protein
MVVGWFSEFYRSWLQDSSISKIETWVSSIWHTLVNILLGMDYLYHLVLLPHRFYARPWSFSNFTRPKKVLFFSLQVKEGAIVVSSTRLRPFKSQNMKPTSLTYVHVGFKLIVYVCLNRAGVIHCIVLVSIECLLYYNVCNQYLYSILHCWGLQ